MFYEHNMKALILFSWVLPVILCAPCHICGNNGNNDLTYPAIVLREFGMTCAEIAVNVAVANKNNTNACVRKQSLYGPKCCRLSSKPASLETDVTIVPYVRYVGPHPICNICRDGDFPSNEAMVVNFLYLGADSCARYFKYGKEGRIPYVFCRAIQYFFYEPCGCGKYNPNYSLNNVG